MPVYIICLMQYVSELKKALALLRRDMQCTLSYPVLSCVSFVKEIYFLIFTWLSSLPGVSKESAEGGACLYAVAQAKNHSKDSDGKGGTIPDNKTE